MADEPEDDETLELTEELEVEEPEAQESEESPEEPEQPEGEDETVVSWGDEALSEEQEDDSAPMRQMRAELRKRDKRIRELEVAAAPKVPDEAPEPQLADFEWDEEAYKTAWRKWNKDQEAREANRAAAESEAREVQTQWQQDLQVFAEKKAAIKFTDAEEADAIVKDAFRPEQWAVMLKATRDPAMFAVALSKSPEKLADLAKIKDVIKLGAEMARMEGGIKVVTKRKAPNLDVPQRGSAKVPGADEADKQLAKLEKEAEASGDRTKLIQYRKQLAAKGK